MAGFKPDYIITEMKKNVVLAWGRPNTALDEYVPGKNRAMEHGPLTVRNVRKPIFHYTAGHAKLYA